jgi:peptidoglycan/xylan/chitin deacetylase (PgdA/CDA1 family)
MAFKHKLKGALREGYARLLFHTGLCALVDKVMPPRLTILAGHCVRPAGGEWPAGEHLPPDMSISERKLDEFLRWFGARFELVSVGAGVERLDRGLSGKSLVALSMDDGYRDNARVLAPLLARHKASGTVYLESRPLDERKVNWAHKYFWILARSTPEDFVQRFGELSSDKDAFHALNQHVCEGRVDLRYHLKLVLKYDAQPAERDRVLDQVFAELGGDERALCDALYMDWDEARAMQRAGIELGGHTVNHPILAKLAPAEQSREIEDGARSIERELGQRARSFAYPWGRRWDFNEHSSRAARESGFGCAVTMHAGVNTPKSERYTLKRLAIDDGAQLHLLAAEACGGFELLRRVGVNLSE